MVSVTMLTACQGKYKAEGQSKPLTQTPNRTVGILNDQIQKSLQVSWTH